MKTILSLAAVAALLIAFQNARAVEDPPEAHLQLVEVEQQTPYLESFAGVAAGTATTSVIRRVGNTGGVVFSSQAYAQFDNHNGDGSRATFPLEVEDADTYGLTAALVKGPNFGIVQLFVDGRQVGGTYDLYARRSRSPPGLARRARALGGHAHADDEGHRQERGLDRLPRWHRPAGARLGDRAPADPDRGRDGRGGRAGAGDARADGRRQASFGAFQPGVARSTRRPRRPTSSRPRATRR